MMTQEGKQEAENKTAPHQSPTKKEPVQLKPQKSLRLAKRDWGEDKMSDENILKKTNSQV